MRRACVVLRFVGLAAVVLALPLAAAGQSPGRVHRVGVLAVAPWSVFDGLRQGLAELGYREGRNLRYEYRWADGRDERLPALAADLAASNVDVIVTWGTPAALAAKQATGRIPIVMGAIGDPVAVGVVSNLARPGGNITGFTTLSQQLEAKRLELLKEIVPTIARTVVLWNDLNPALDVAVQHLRAASASLRLSATFIAAHDAAGLERALAAMARQPADALMIIADPFLMTQRRRIAEFSTSRRLPSVSNYRDYAEAGGLLSYGPDYADLFRRAAGYVDRILRGTPPAELPIQEPSKFDLVVNLRTARALGITIPPSVLIRAEQLID